MNNISIFICLYISLSIFVGLYSTKFIKSSKDFCLAGRNLPLLLCSSTMFSTWFGAETIVGASGEFLQHGLLGIIEDPFGTSLCFILIGLFIARPLYKLNIITVVDLFKIKYGNGFEKVSAIFMIISYLGWIAAQFVAMAIILNTIFDLPLLHGIIYSCSIVCIYTICGGMWSISINDFIQTIVIIVGLLAISFYMYFYIYVDIDFYTAIQQKAINTTKLFQFVPDYNIDSWTKYIVAWLTIGLGSIPQQDVFQRVMSAKSQNTAINSSYISALMYIIIGCLPFMIALAFKVSDASLQQLPHDQVLLQGILHNTNDIIKTIFFGALLSAIMSSASGAILAPATILAENIIKPLKPTITDKTMLAILRLSVLGTVIVSALYAIYSPDVYLLVAESSIISLVTLFAPFIAALYWSKACKIGAFSSILLGPVVLFMCTAMGLSYPSSILIGFAASMIAMYLPYYRWTARTNFGA